MDVRDDYGRTALHVTASRGHEGATKLLLDQKSKVDARDEDGCTPLFCAVREGRPRVVELLLARGADPNAPTKKKSTPIVAAAMRGRTTEARILLRAGARANAEHEDGSVLAQAAYRGAAGVARALLDHAPDLDKGPALLEAAAEGYLPIVKLLVARGADPAWRSPRGNDALGLARKRKRSAVASWLKKEIAGRDAQR